MMIVKYFHRSVDLINSINKKITSNELIKKRDRVLLSISGGQDSICLMFLLNHLYDQMDLHLGLFWCHHLWQFDSFSLMRQITKLSFLFQFNGYFAISPNFIPSELLARHWRHNCNYRVCFFYNYYKISLAHSANDKVETIFLNLMRGAGLSGLFPLRWTQSVSQKRVQNEEHISQFSTFIFSPFFWYTASLAILCCPSSFRLLHQNTEDSKLRKNLPKFHYIDYVNRAIFASSYGSEWNRKKKESPCYYFRYVYLEGTDIILLPISSYADPLLGKSYRAKLRYGRNKGHPTVSLPRAVRTKYSTHSGSAVRTKYSTLRYRRSSGMEVKQAVQLFFYIPITTITSITTFGGTGGTGETGGTNVHFNKDCILARILKKACYQYRGNRKQEDSLILKKTNLIILKKKSQKKMKFKHKSKKLTAKKWFSYVSYTFLKVCL